MADATAAEPAAGLEPIQALESDVDEDGDDDSALGIDDAASSTASITSSILSYRTVNGRTYHSDKYNSDHLLPNDERQLESIDIAHHAFTLLLDGKLFVAPIGDNVQKVIDVGTGTGIWAIDFADQFPEAQVIGTDLSPTQPSWVPPNLRFELDDATKRWNFESNTFDFVHIRQLAGHIADYNHLFAEAFRVCKPGGWVQSYEPDVAFYSDDGTTDNDPAVKTWNQLVREGAEKFGFTLDIIGNDLQRKGFEAAGFEDIQIKNQKSIVGAWPADKRLRHIGQFGRLALESDLDGYTQMLWQAMGWPMDGHQVFLAQVRKMMRSKSVHPYMKGRYVYGRKPL